MKRILLSAAILAAAAAFAVPYKDGDVVVFFGDSITHGGRYHEYVTDYYRTRFPEAKIRFVNSGIGGDTARGAFRRIPEDIAEYAPTHVTFHFGMNDINRGAYLVESTAQSLKDRELAQTAYRENFRKLADGVRKAAPQAKFTYLTPTPYDQYAVVTNAPKSGWASVNNVGCNEGLSLMAGFCIASAAKDGADFVDWHSLLNNFMQRHQKGDPHFSITGPDRVHPREMGHSIMAWEFLKRQGAPAVVSEVVVDASAKTAKAENAAVTDLACADGRVAFTLAAKALPLPVHEKALPYVAEFDVENALNRETVKVTGLAAGTYALKIDGEEVGRSAAAEFAEGIHLGFNAKTPQYRQAQAVAKRCRELCNREAVLRNHHSARWFFGNHGQDVDDIPAFRTWYETNVKTGKAGEWGGYFGKFIPGYLEYWPKYKAVREALWKDQDAVRELAKPVPHRYEIVRLVQ